MDKLPPLRDQNSAKAKSAKRHRVILAWALNVIAAFCVLYQIPAVRHALRSYRCHLSPAKEAHLIEELLTDMYPGTVKNRTPLVISEHLSISSLSMGDDVHEAARQIVRQAMAINPQLGEAASDWEEKNHEDHPISGLGHLAIAHAIFDRKTRDEVFESTPNSPKEGWKRFHKRFPKSSGYHILSRPGISSDGSIVIIYEEFLAGPLFGHGSLHVYERKNGQWVPALYILGPTWFA